MGIASSKEDMAICFVVFNPAETRRILMNYLYAKNIFDSQGLPSYTIELVYKGCKPSLPNAIHVSTNSIMFHKENLYRILEKHIPKKYTKLAFLDCDILFPDESWYYRTSLLLDTHDVVQPFETAHWMDLTYSKIMMSRKTVLCMQEKEWNFKYHPGFAWCMRRDWYRKNGFFDFAVSGSGDTLSSIVWLQKTLPKGFQSLPISLVSEYQKFIVNMKVPKITFLKDMNVFHLYHGSRVNRQYSERHKMLNIAKSIREMTTYNEDGVLEWKHPEVWNKVFLKYFQSRNDDDLSEEDIVIQEKSCQTS